MPAHITRHGCHADAITPLLIFDAATLLMPPLMFRRHFAMLL